MVDMSRMTTVYLGLLTRGPRAAKWDAKPDELAKLQEAHLASNSRLVESGKLILLGPFTDDGYLRGVFVFKTDSLEEAEALAATDPSVQAGRLALSFIPG
ncbi:MAG: YciI family protein [Chloroflexota bacterium]